ncbi:Wadjet anti-phage system protein JetD domain-containing protein [Pseudogulbenkiania sp. MAI-1]|uniref:Wadjet anti-phage system protein JetD domain-containing protein n=1 Tax=Pseudogulbenkiania sp. MAI-1 TaxID=990370 RepID=UPI000A0298DB
MRRCGGGGEAEPATRELARLEPQGLALYDELRAHRIRPKLRLEQERVGFQWVKTALSALARASRL